MSSLDGFFSRLSQQLPAPKVSAVVQELMDEPVCQTIAAELEQPVEVLAMVYSIILKHDTGRRPVCGPQCRAHGGFKNTRGSKVERQAAQLLQGPA